jgi:hypothetical protein
MRGMEWAASRHPIQHGRSRYYCQAVNVLGCTWHVDTRRPDYLDRPADCPAHELPVTVPSAEVEDHG